MSWCHNGWIESGRSQATYYVGMSGDMEAHLTLIWLGERAKIAVMVAEDAESFSASGSGEAGDPQF